MSRARGPCVAILLVLLTAVIPRPLAAQTADAAVGFRGFFDAGHLAASAAESFRAVLGESGGPLIGGGVQVTLPNGLYFELAARRFRETGERVFVHEGEVFRLGIPTTIGLSPVDVTAGYRFRPFGRVVPYAGGGLGTQRYTETSEFAAPGENVDVRHGSRRIAAGVEVGITRWLTGGFEVSHRWVPDAIGAAGVAAVFGETDLGGTSASLRLLVGR